ncbi:acetolactate synthase 2 catalytic subunit [Psychrosphaera sp. 1_MG-2023]|uniref:acetolactate synthase 2 catalytic subunit n=1 Tax=Psychrosphaera sp. 1_MG-2023 TaxID=3062643 RepID=UPI0026E46D1D|nr:acetolactate synthase 2 catalytic subunit [Psychrosphaera sp. 1_MG-2023]MDO6718886.1 acetolactate synthase 2 catalytic subunit [Psychrosphaera sp. 1_MG-2023]
MKTGADLIIDTLYDLGATEVFGYPGGTIMPVYDALFRSLERGSPVKHYLCRHEQGAGFAAVGFARSTGKTGVCIATSGPGATNLITALADAKLDSVPVVAITGQVPRPLMGTNAFQEVDVFGLSVASCKHSFQVMDQSELEDTIRQAFIIANEGRPGPVLIDIPKDVQMNTIVKQRSLVLPRQPEQTARSEQFEQAKQLILKAQKPIFYIGGGVDLAGVTDELNQVLRTTQLPAVSTLKGLGSVEPEYAYSLGMLGMHGNAGANLAVQDCDLLIALGARFDDRVTGRLASFAPNAKVLHIDIDNSEINKLRQVELAINCNLKTAMSLLHKELTVLSAEQQQSWQSWRDTCTQLAEDHQWRYDFPHDGIYAPSLLKQLSDKLTPASVVTCDVGQHQMWVAQHMSFASTKNHLSSGGAGTMGFGLPAAVGAKVARPNDQVIAVCGDGSIMMNIQELGTIKRFNLGVKVLLIDNAKLGMVKQWQELFFDQRLSETDLSDNPEFVMLAKAFDIPGQTITKQSEVAGALETLVQHDGPYFLHVKIDAGDNVWPLVPPGAANQDMIDHSQQTS